MVSDPDGERVAPHVERYWSARDGSVALDDHGFLRDPTPHDLVGSLNPQVTSTSGLGSVRCLVLLGEPGSGKSSSLGMDPSVPAPLGILPVGFVGEVLAVPLGNYRSEDRLADRIENDPLIAAWRKGEGHLALVLDAFDECQSGVEHLARMLTGYLSEWPTERMVLRIACRTAQWPSGLEARLVQSFVRAEDDPLFTEGFRAVEISPLMAADVAMIAAARGLDGEGLVRAVRQSHVGALAARPLLLRMILDEFAAGSVPDDALMLYRRSTKRLALEYDDLRGDRPAVSGDAAVAVARWIAANVVFGAAPAVATSDEPNADDLTVASLTGDGEPSDGTGVEVTRAAVDQLLSSGLFSSRGPSRFGFAHYSFAEFLAAEWLHARASDEAVGQLLRASDGVVAPTLRNVAAWLVAMDPARWAWIANDDPDVVLSGAVDIPSPAIRAAVVERILDGAGAELWQRRFYAGIRFDGLADRLRPELRSDAPERVLLACEMAMDCNLIELAPELTAMVFDDSAPMQARIRAALAIERFGEEAPSAALAPLITTNLVGDRSDELRGLALDASWPHAVGLETVLGVLTPPKQRNLIGHYRHFISYRFAPTLRADQLDVLLPWLVDLERAGGPDDDFGTLADRIVTLACTAPADRSRDELLARLLWRRTEHAKHVLLDSFRRRTPPDPLADVDRRHDVIRAMFDVMDEDTGYDWHLTDGPAAVCRTADFAWLATEARSLSGRSRDRAISLAERVFRWQDRECVDTLLALDETDPVRVQLQHWIDPLPVNGEAHMRWRREQERAAPSDAVIEQRVFDALNLFDAGDPVGFALADQAVAIEPGSHQPNGPHIAPMSQRLRWIRLTAVTQARLVDAAEHFVNMEPDERSRRPPAPLHAFILLAALRPEALVVLPGALWSAWAASIFETARWSESSDPLIEVLNRAHTKAPGELRSAALDHVRSGLTTHVFLRDHIAKAIWDDEFAAGLLELRPQAGPEAHEDITELLTTHAFALIRDEIIAEMSTSSADLKDRVLAGQYLLRNGTAEDWRSVLARAYANADFGRSLVEAAASRLRHLPDPPLEPAEIADLFEWVSKLFPSSEDPPWANGFVSTREQVSQWRDSLPQILASNGDAASVAALRRLAERFPERDLIAVRLRDALDQHRRNEFRSVDPIDLRRLVQSRSRLLVRNAAELRELILRVLVEIETGVLHGDTPQAPLMWDERPNAKPVPKSEEAVADFVATWIEERLSGMSATALREVSSRRVSRTGIPERTDILVHVRTGSGTAAVIVECKGCWNAGLYTEMRSQLVGRYMVDRPAAEGIFLGFWFDPAAWNSDDARRGRCTGMTREGLRSRLEAQAAELIAEGARVSAAVLDLSYRRRA